MIPEKEDAVISQFLQSMGPWKDIIVIGGGYALIIYKLYLADKDLKTSPVGTRDIDTLIPRRIPIIDKKDISKYLHEAGFTQMFKDLEHPATESYIKDINGFEIEIEFITDSSSRVDKHKNIVIAGVVAQPLSYLSLSLQTTQKFQTYSGEQGLVVAPGAWMFHKGLTFTKRKNISKVHKDLYGIWYVATQLGKFSEDALKELFSLGSYHPKWFKTLKDNLQNWLQNVSPLEWTQIESQDPAGKLKRLNFEKVIMKIIQYEPL